MREPRFTPTGDRVLVRRLPEKKSLIVLTDADPNIYAKVTAVGPGINGRPLCVKKGDVVIVPGVANRYPDWQEDENILIREGDIGLIVNISSSEQN